MALQRHSFSPVADVLERLLIRHVVDEKDSHRAAVVGGRDRAEALLAGRVLSSDDQRAHAKGAAHKHGCEQRMRASMRMAIHPSQRAGARSHGWRERVAQWTDPDLQLDALAIQLDGLDLEINSVHSRGFESNVGANARK